MFFPSYEFFKQNYYEIFVSSTSLAYIILKVLFLILYSLKFSFKVNFKSLPFLSIPELREVSPGLLTNLFVQFIMKLSHNVLFYYYFGVHAM